MLYPRFIANSASDLIRMLTFPQAESQRAALEREMREKVEKAQKEVCIATIKPGATLAKHEKISFKE